MLEYILTYLSCTQTSTVVGVFLPSSKIANTDISRVARLISFNRLDKALPDYYNDLVSSLISGFKTIKEGEEVKVICLSLIVSLLPMVYVVKFIESEEYDIVLLALRKSLNAKTILQPLMKFSTFYLIFKKNKHLFNYLLSSPILKKEELKIHLLIVRLIGLNADRCEEVLKVVEGKEGVFGSILRITSSGTFKSFSSHISKN